MTSLKISRTLQWATVLLALTMMLTACAPRAVSRPEAVPSPISQPVAETIPPLTEVLAEAFPTVQPPATPMAPEEIKEAAGEIIAELGKTVGRAGVDALEPPEVVAGIRAMMARALEEYAEGEPDEAFEFAANAYLEGFERIEGDLIQQGHRELVEDLELKFKDLRDGVRAGKPQAELQALVEEIEQGLDEALNILTAGG